MTITLSAWETANRLRIDEQVMPTLSDCVPHIVLKPGKLNERLFPANYIDACIEYTRKYGFTLSRETLLMFRDTRGAVTHIRRAQYELEAAFYCHPTEGRGAQELSLEEMAFILGVSLPTINRWQAAGTFPKVDKIPKAMLGNSYRWVLT